MSEPTGQRRLSGFRTRRKAKLRPLAQAQKVDLRYNHTTRRLDRWLTCMVCDRWYRAIVYSRTCGGTGCHSRKGET